MTTLTATPNPAAGSVTLAMTALPADAVLTRDAGNGPEIVRGADSLPAGDLTIIDSEAPLDVPLVYQVTGPAEAITQLQGIGSWLTHPDGRSMRVTVQNDDPLEYGSDGQAHDVLGSLLPLVTYYPRSTRTGDLALRIPWADRATLWSLVSDGSPLLLRAPAGCMLDSGWLWPESIQHTHAVNAPDAQVTLQYRRVAAPPLTGTTPPVAWTWAAVDSTWADWSAVVAARASWADLLGMGPTMGMPTGGWGL